MALMWCAIRSGGTCFEFGRVLDDPAQAFRGCAAREPERRGIALDVMGGAKQFLPRVAVLNPFIRSRRGQPTDVGLDRHPVPEFAERRRERLFRAPTGSSRSTPATRRNTLRNGLGCVINMMVGEALDLERYGFLILPCAVLAPLDSGPRLVEQRGLLITSIRRRRGARGDIGVGGVAGGGRVRN